MSVTDDQIRQHIDKIFLQYDGDGSGLLDSR